MDVDERVACICLSLRSVCLDNLKIVAGERQERKREAGITAPDECVDDWETICF
jgi:hypothetical protein